MNTSDLIQALDVAVAITSLAVITLYVPAFIQNFFAKRNGSAEAEAQDYAWLLIGGILMGWTSCAFNYWWLVYVFYGLGLEPTMAPYLPRLPRITWLMGWLLSGAIHIAISQRKRLGLLRTLVYWLAFITSVVLLIVRAEAG